jgi:hypothetical protein
MNPSPSRVIRVSRRARARANMLVRGLQASVSPVRQLLIAAFATCDNESTSRLTSRNTDMALT